MRYFSCAAIAAVFTILATAGRAEESLTAGETRFFESKIRPLLIERCYKCHSEAEQIKGGLRLDSRDGWQMGGDTGTAIVPGKPDESLLIKAIRYQDPDLQMPPMGKLSATEIGWLEEWVRTGAPDPRNSTSNPAAIAGTDDPPNARSHWAFQPLTLPIVPDVQARTWPYSDVDRFILASLESKGLSPSADASRHRWLRRVNLDLIGLPPTVHELNEFFDDHSEGAFEKVVDRLLASPAFGERWARPWLDLVGYADQIGSANNVPADFAWRYRDYVIRAFNQDKPFDRFVREQIAGDLMESDSIEERQDQIIATGFLVLGNVNIVEADKLVMEMDIVDQQIEKVGKAFLGLTLNCVRCHDHKFDPVSLADYYGLAGIFSSTESTHKTDRGVWSTLTTTQIPETLGQFTRRQTDLRNHEKKIAEVEKDRTEVQLRLRDLDQRILVAKNQATPTSDSSSNGQAVPVADLEKERNELASKLPTFDQRLWHLKYLEPAPPIVYSVKNAPHVGDARIQVRGNPHTLGKQVPRGFVRVATHGTIPGVAPEQSGRLELAQWLTDSASPLLSRVTVNRIWCQLFGRGIVASVDYLGVRGDLPTHPELLDYLAGQFRRDRFSVKRLIRQLVLSRTYRQQTEADAMTGSARAVDPDNHFYWKASPRRLDAEMLRDSVLAVSGLLEMHDGGPALASEFKENVGGLDPKDVNPISFSLNKFRESQQRIRTIYLPVVRSSEQRGPADVLNFFDFPQPARFTGERPTTAVASQTLFLLNGPLLKTASQKLVELTLSEPTLTTDELRVGGLFERVLCRPPTNSETTRAIEFLNAASQTDQISEGDRKISKDAWQQLIHALLASNEFLFRL